MKKTFSPLIATAVVAAAAGAAGGAGLTARAEAEAPTRVQPLPQDVASGDTAWVVTSEGVQYCFLYNSTPYCRAAQRWY